MNLGVTPREDIKRILQNSRKKKGRGEFVRGGIQGFKSMKVNNKRKEKTECLDQGLVCILVFFILFSKHLMILTLMVYRFTLCSNFISRVLT